MPNGLKRTERYTEKVILIWITDTLTAMYMSYGEFLIMWWIQIIKDPYERAGELLDILVRRDDDLLSEFYKALQDSGQHHVARLLVYKGLTLSCSIFWNFMIWLIKQLIHVKHQLLSSRVLYVSVIMCSSFLLATVSSRAGASSERWCRGILGPPVNPGPSKPTNFLGLCSPDHRVK